MEPRRRVLGVAIAVVVFAGLPIARPAAQPGCDAGVENAPGPICATLAPPQTYYEVLDIDLDRDKSIIWSASTVSCGNFYGSATALDQNGEEIDDETGINSLWGHANGAPDNCSHNAPDHPGTIVADINSGEYFSNLQKIHIPGVWTRCTYSGSGSGTGPVCGPPPPEPTCVEEEGDVAVTTGGADVEVRAERNELVIDFSDSDEPGCSAPLVDVQTMTILGDSSDDTVTLDMNQSLMDLFRGARPGLGINLDGGANEVRIKWADSLDRVAVSPAPYQSGSGLSLDATGEGVPDIGIVNGDRLDLDLGEGADRVFIDALNKQILGSWSQPLLTVDGGGGDDSATVAPLPSAPAYLGEDPPVMRWAQQVGEVTVNVNLDGGDGDSVDVSALGFERLTATGSSAAETIVAAGGAGTGSVLTLPITILGKGGKDRLTGGAANDKLNGGPDRDVCNGGKGRDTASKCETTKGVP